MTRESFNLGVIVDYDLFSTDIRAQRCKENMFQALLSPSFAPHSTTKKVLTLKKTKNKEIQPKPLKTIIIVNVCPDRESNELAFHLLHPQATCVNTER